MVYYGIKKKKYDSINLLCLKGKGEKAPKKGLSLKQIQTLILLL